MKRYMYFITSIPIEDSTYDGMTEIPLPSNEVGWRLVSTTATTTHVIFTWRILRPY